MLKFKGFTWEQDLVDWVNSNPEIKILTITSNSELSNDYILWYYE